MTKKEKTLAMATALQSYADRIIVVDSFSTFKLEKTKALIQILENLGASPLREKVTLITEASYSSLQRVCRNVSNLSLLRPSTNNVIDILNSDKILVDKESLENF